MRIHALLMKPKDFKSFSIAALLAFASPSTLDAQPIENLVGFATTTTSQHTIIGSRVNYEYAAAKMDNVGMGSWRKEKKVALPMQSQKKEEEELFTRQILKRGRPSNPGWRRRKGDKSLNELTDWATADEANRPIICEWEPDAVWLWTKWRGTAISVTYVPTLINIAMGIGVDRLVHFYSESSWALLAVPPESDPIIQQLVGMKTLWEYQLTLCTFILAFFTSQAYTHWRSVYFCTRAIQGRINDVCMLLTISAKRSNVTNNVNRQVVTTGYDKDARELVSTCTRLMRLSHTFFWASTPTISNGVGDGAVLDGDHNSDIPKSQRSNDAIGPLLLSPMGLQGLVEANELTREEKKALLYSGLPPSQYPYVLLEWVGLYAMEGLRDGILDGGFGLEDQLMKRLTDVRAEYFSIGDFAGKRLVCTIHPCGRIQNEQKVEKQSKYLLAPNFVNVD